MSSGSIGSFERRSARTNRPNENAASANRPRIVGELHPKSFALMSAYTRPKEPADRLAMPDQSIACDADSSRDSSMRNSVRTSARRPMGMLM